VHGRARLDLAARLINGGENLRTGAHALEPLGQGLDSEGVRRLVMCFGVVTGHGWTFRLPQAFSCILAQPHANCANIRPDSRPT